MPISGDLPATAMAAVTHVDGERALELRNDRTCRLRDRYGIG